MMKRKIKRGYDADLGIDVDKGFHFEITPGRRIHVTNMKKKKHYYFPP